MKGVVFGDNELPWDDTESKNVIDVLMPFCSSDIFHECIIERTNKKSGLRGMDYNKANKTGGSVALAIKYRPRTFDQLIGQDGISKTLSLALRSNKLTHAYLFSGPRGSGKTSSARILARCLQCLDGISDKPCDQCDSCVSALKGSHMDIIELDGASNRRIDDIRELIEQTKYKPSSGRFKIFIIDEVHMLTREAFNSLLKTLEEPPSFVKFILATTDPLKVPSTILSRTQHFRFKKIAPHSLVLHIESILKKEKVLYDTKALDMIVRNGGGSARDTLMVLDQSILYCDGNITVDKLSEMFGSIDPSNFDALFDALFDRDSDFCMDFVNKMCDYECETVIDEMMAYTKSRILEYKLPVILGARYCNILNDAKRTLQSNSDPEFCLLLTVLKMLEAQKIREISDVIESKRNATNFHSSRGDGKKSEVAMDSQVQIKKLEATRDNILSSASNSSKSVHDDAKQDPTPISPSVEKKGDISTPGHGHSSANTNTSIKLEIESKIASLSGRITSETPVPKKTTDAELVRNDANMSQKGRDLAIDKAGLELYRKFVSVLYDRDIDIADLFCDVASFDGYLDGTLSLIFSAEESKLQRLRESWKAISGIAKTVFGVYTKISVVKRPFPSDRQEPDISSSSTPSCSDGLSRDEKGAVGVDNAAVSKLRSEAKPVSSGVEFTENSRDVASHGRAGAKTSEDYFTEDDKKMIQELKNKLGVFHVSVKSSTD